MSTVEHGGGLPARERPPASELEYRYDDADHPETVTVFDPTNERIATEWVTIDRGHAVPFEEMR